MGVVCSFSLLYSVPLYEYIHFTIDDCLGCFHFSIVMILLAVMNILEHNLCTYVHNPPRVEDMHVCSALLDTVESISKVVVPFYISTNNE